MAFLSSFDDSPDWWTDNAPPPPANTGAVTNPVGSGTPWTPGATQPSSAPPGYHWDPSMANFVADAPSASSGGRTDRNAILAQVAKWAAMPGADPSLASNPDYWADRIIEKGGLGDDNRQYWQDAGVGDNAFFRHPERESGGSSPFGTAGVQSSLYQPPPAPNYTPYNPGQAPTPTMFRAPTAEEARNTPGYQFAVEEGQKGLERSAAARGNLLSGGALKDITNYRVGAADANYQNVWGNAFNANNANNASALNAYSAGAGANVAAGGLNLNGANSQFQNTYGPSWNAYLSKVGQDQFGADFGLRSQNQFWTQGFNENQNAYNQYDNSQKTAFDQWYKMMQAGHPGNPYAP